MSSLGPELIEFGHVGAETEEGPSLTNIELDEIMKPDSNPEYLTSRVSKQHLDPWSGYAILMNLLMGAGPFR